MGYLLISIVDHAITMFCDFLWRPQWYARKFILLPVLSTTPLQIRIALGFAPMHTPPRTSEPPGTFLASPVIREHRLSKPITKLAKRN